MSYYTQHPRPALTADVVAVAGADEDLRVLLIKRGNPPFQGAWALPGGFVDEGEEPEFAARRELAEETGLAWEEELELVGVYGEPGRDPRGWTVSVAYLLDAGDTLLTVLGGDDASEAAWHPVFGLPELAFDHSRIISDALALLGD